MKDRELRVVWRGWRWFVEPDDASFVGFLAAEPGWRKLRQEAFLLERLAAADLPVPAVAFENEDLRLQVRDRIPGIVGQDVERLCFGTARLPDAAARYGPDCPLTDRGKRLAEDLGPAVALLHRAVPVGEARAMGFADREPADWARVSSVLRTHAPDLISAVFHVQRWESDLPRETGLTHGDLHLSNVAVDPDTGSLSGLFDFDAACLAHPYEDLKFAPSTGLPFARRMLRTYAETTGGQTSLPLLYRFHLRAALTHFEHVSPNSDRFPEIIDWSRAALGALIPEWGAHRG